MENYEDLAICMINDGSEYHAHLATAYLNNKFSRARHWTILVSRYAGTYEARWKVVLSCQDVLRASAYLEDHYQSELAENARAERHSPNL